jgi:hypothetical protein
LPYNTPIGYPIFLLAPAFLALPAVTKVRQLPDVRSLPQSKILSNLEGQILRLSVAAAAERCEVLLTIQL